MDIGDDAIENGKIGRRQKRLCGGKRLSPVTDRVHEVHQAGAKLFVIVNDRYK